MYKVERAIIMAAGMGKRMYPLTVKTPKPLVDVNGKRMIDSVVEALEKNGITEIYVVVGYLKDQFYKWSETKKNIHIIENPDYESCNNISSLYYAKEYLGNCMILDGDQIVNNISALDKHFIMSGYNAIWSSNWTNEWLMTVEDGVVNSCFRNGGKEGWQLYSVSRWTKEDGRVLADLVKKEYEAGNTSIYWDDIPMFLYFDRFKLTIKKMDLNDIVEIDSLEELIRIDPKYNKNA